MLNLTPPSVPTRSVSHALGGLVASVAERLGLHDFVRGYAASFARDESKLESFLASLANQMVGMYPLLVPYLAGLFGQSLPAVPTEEVQEPEGEARPTSVSSAMAAETLARVMRHAGPGARPGGPPTNLRDLGATQAQMNAATKPPSAS